MGFSPQSYLNEGHCGQTGLRACVKMVPSGLLQYTFLKNFKHISLAKRDAAVKNIVLKSSAVICPRCYSFERPSAQPNRPAGTVARGRGNRLPGRRSLEPTQIWVDGLTGEFLPNPFGL